MNPFAVDKEPVPCPVCKHGDTNGVAIVRGGDMTRILELARWCPACGAFRGVTNGVAGTEWKRPAASLGDDLRALCAEFGWTYEHDKMLRKGHGMMVRPLREGGWGAWFSLPHRPVVTDTARRAIEACERISEAFAVRQ